MMSKDRSPRSLSLAHHIKFTEIEYLDRNIIPDSVQTRDFTMLIQPEFISEFKFESEPESEVELECPMFKFDCRNL